MPDKALRLPVELRFSSSMVNRRAGRRFTIVQLLLTGLTVVLVAALLYPTFSDAPREAFWPELWRELLAQPKMPLYWLGMAALLGGSIYIARLLKTARLRLNRVGLEASMPRLLGLFGLRQTTGEWRLAWHEIRRARRIDINPAPALSNRMRRLSTIRLLLETERGEYWLFPYAWHDPDNDHRMTWRELMSTQMLGRGVVQTATPLEQALEQQGIEITADSDTRKFSAGFDLTSHKGLGAMLVILFAAAGYAALDQFFFGQFLALEALPLWPFGATAMLAAALLLPLGQGAPKVERGVVSLLALAAVLSAVWPGMLRYNALTATPELITYITREAALFDPPDPALPTIDLRRADLVDYFAQFPPGSTHEFILLEGALGVWQLDRRDLHARTRAFYRAHDERQRASH